jgi:type I restriction enzyme S subunit
MVGIASAATHAYRDKGVPLLRNQNIKPNYLDDGDVLHVDPTYEVAFRNKRLRTGDLLTARTGYPGTTCAVPEKFESAQSFTTLITRPKTQLIDSLYLCQYINSERGQKFFEQTQIGGAQKNVNAGTLRTMPVPVPQMEEQRAIATALSDVDNLLTKLDQIIIKKRDLKQAAMQQLLTGQIRLPGFSGVWEMRQLGQISDLRRDHVVPANFPKQVFVHFSLPAFDAGKVPVFETGSEIGSNKFRIPEGAVLVSKLNPRIPRVWAPIDIPEQSIASTEFLVLLPKPFISREFLYVFCASPYFCEQMELAATGTTGSHQRISPLGALGIAISLPLDLEEQTAIAAVLSDMDTEITALEARREKTRALKKGMMQELLTGRIRLV